MAQGALPFKTEVEPLSRRPDILAMNRHFGLGDYKLWYMRNKDKQEVDFLVTEGDRPQFMVEAKLTDTAVSPHLIKFQDILNIPAIQLVNGRDTAGKIKNESNTIHYSFEKGNEFITHEPERIVLVTS